MSQRNKTKSEPSAADRIQEKQKKLKKGADVYVKGRVSREKEIAEVDSAVVSTEEAEPPARGRKPSKKNRVTTTIVMDPELKDWAKGYCWRHKVVLSDLIDEYLRDLQKQEGNV